MGKARRTKRQKIAARTRLATQPQVLPSEKTQNQQVYAFDSEPSLKLNQNSTLKSRALPPQSYSHVVADTRRSLIVFLALIAMNFLFFLLWKNSILTLSMFGM